MDTNFITDNTSEYTLTTIEIIQPPIVLTQDALNYILGNIQFNYLLIIFTIGCFTSLLCCEKRNRTLIHPYNETQPIITKI